MGPRGSFIVSQAFGRRCSFSSDWSFVAVLVLVSVLGTAVAQSGAGKKISQAAPDTLQQHYDAARTFQLSRDNEHAAAEYKTFLSEALRRIANAHFHGGSYERAAQLFAQALALAPTNAVLYVDSAALRLEQGNVAEARSLAEKAVELAPGNAKAEYVLGSVLFQQGDLQGAREQLEKAVVTAPSFETGYLLGITYIKLNDLNRANLLFEEMVAGLGDSAEIHVYFGRAYRQGDQLDQAIAELRKAVAKDPKIKQAHYLLAMAYLERDGDSGFAEAAPEFESELKVNPGDARTHYMIGYIALKQRELKTAEQQLVSARDLDPENPDPLVSLGQLYFETGRLAPAETTLRRAIELTTDPARNGYQINRVHYSLGRLLLATGREEEGKKELQISAELRDKPHAEHRGKSGPETEKPPDSSRPAIHASPEEIKRVEEFTDELRPALADAYNNLGVIAAGGKDYAASLEDFSQAAQWNPTLETVERNLGMAAFYANQFERAMVPLAHELERHPEDARVRAALGLTLFSLEHYAGAVTTLAPLGTEIDQDPGLAYAYAVSLVKTGDYNQGINRLKAIAKGNVNSAEVHTLLGQAFADQAEYGEALDEYHKALAIDPHHERTHFLAGLALIRQGSSAEAAREFREALRLDPSDVSSKYHLAYSLIALEEKQDAVPLLEEVIQQDPKHADAYYQLGKLELEEGDTKRAISNLETGTKLNPDGDYIHYQLALAYRRQARNEDAEREMKLYQALKKRHRGRNEPQPN